MRRGCLWRRKLGRAGIVVLRAWTLSRIPALSPPASYFLCRNVEWRRATLRNNSRNSLGVTVTYCFAVTKWGLFFVINKIYVCKKRMPFLTCRWAAAWAEFCSTFSVCAPPAWHNFPAWRRHTKKRLDQNTTKKAIAQQWTVSTPIFQHKILCD